METNTTIEAVEKSNYPAIFDLPELPGQDEKAGPKFEVTPQQLKKLIDLYATDSRTIAQLAPEFGIKEPNCLYAILNRYPAIAKYYSEASKYRADVLVDKTLEIAMDDSRDVLETPNGPIGNHTAVRRADLKIKTMQWTASRLNRAKWGDKQEIEVNQTNRNLNIDITPGKFDAMDISDACQIFTQK